MVGGTTNTAQIYKASLGRSENRFRFKKEENKSPVTHALEVSLDRADNIIEGAPPSFSEGGFFVAPAARRGLDFRSAGILPAFFLSPHATLPGLPSVLLIG